jgi:hypothetical protein
MNIFNRPPKTITLENQKSVLQGRRDPVTGQAILRTEADAESHRKYVAALKPDGMVETSSPRACSLVSNRYGQSGMAAVPQVERSANASSNLSRRAIPIRFEPLAAKAPKRISLSYAVSAMVANSSMRRFRLMPLALARLRSLACCFREF